MRKLFCWFGWHGEPEFEKYEQGLDILNCLTGYCPHCGKKLI